MDCERLARLILKPWPWINISGRCRGDWSNVRPPYTGKWPEAREFGWGNKAENLIWWHGLSHWAKLSQTAMVGISLCVCLPFFSFIFCCSALSFLSVFLPSSPYVGLTHSLMHARTHKQLQVISCESCLAMTLTSLQSLLGSFAAEITSFCLEEYRVSYLFSCLHTSNSPIPLCLFLLSTPTSVHPFVFPIYQPTPEYTHTHTRIYRWFSGLLCTDGYGSIALGKRITLSTFCWIADVMSIHSTAVTIDGAELAALMNR